MKSKTVNFNYADFEPIKNTALTFPGTEESTSHEKTPSIKVCGKLMCRLHDSGEFSSQQRLRHGTLRKQPDFSFFVATSPARDVA